MKNQRWGQTTKGNGNQVEPKGIRLQSNLERMLISGKWELHRRFLDLAEPHLETTWQDFLREIEQQAQQIDDKRGREEFYEFYVPEEYFDHQELLVILTHSFFVASFALFENQLLQICKNAQRKCGNPISVGDLGSRSPTDRAKTYLAKLGIQFPADTPEWSEITKYREIRNKIVHQGGNLPPEGNVTHFAKAKQVVSSDAEGTRLELTRQFCDESLGNLRRFILKVHTAYERWHKDNK